MPNKLREKLDAGNAAIGAIVSFPLPEVVEIFADAGFDWLNIEGEHAPFSVREVQTLLQVADRTDAFAAVRLPENDPVLYKQYLDIGAYGIIVPMVSTREDAEAAVRASRYPPRGIRGYGPRRASGYNTKGAQYFREFEKDLMIIPIIETKEAVENIDEILAVDGIDTFLIGPADLSISMGIPLDNSHERYKAAEEKILRAAKRAGKPAGAGSLDPLYVKRLIKRGFQLILTGGDYYYMGDRAREVIRRIRD